MAKYRPISLRKVPRQPHILPVAIVGGGLGGIALALALQRKNIPVVVFEKDENFAFRRQGYALTIQQGTSALKDLGVDHTVFCEGVTSLAHVSLTSSGALLGAYGVTVRENICASDKAEPPSTSGRSQEPSLPQNAQQRHNVHIPRQRLREIMMNEVNPQAFTWGKKLQSFSLVPQPQAAQPSSDLTTPARSIVQLQFSDGHTCLASALVGADGIHSRVRQLLIPDNLPGQTNCSGTDEQCTVPHGAELPAGTCRAAPASSLRFLGLMVILGISPHIIGGEPLVDGRPVSQPGRQQTQWVDGSTRCFSMPFGDGVHTMWQLSYPLDLTTAMSITSCADLKAEALRCVANWHHQLVDLISATDTDQVSGHPVFDRDPLDPSHITALLGPDCPVTLLGDAAHPMSPFKGQGANQALLDANSLAKALEYSDLVHVGQRSLAKALRAYEQDMCKRSAAKVLKSRFSAACLHSPAALAEGNVTRAGAAEMVLTDNVIMPAIV